ncbi:beclin-1-like protein isoform X1 [Harmonia axyridis]|uniref:beclin-1-like protein isoform X1 n=1 Tax=Harmonia axyridis TaxID=115357 RepID=UPI001E277CEB|nr:beclin-1-like protein isoform X1 [Harmonia axyridis]
MTEERVCFTCQRCSQPLALDDSFSNISEHEKAELNLPLHSNTDVDLESQMTSFDNYVHPFRLSESGNGVNGFLLISDEEDDTSLPSHKARIYTHLFDAISGNSNIDHPLCEECADYMMEIMEQEIEMKQTDLKDYEEYLKRLENDKKELKLGDLEKELAELKAQEARFLEELESINKEEQELKKAIAEQKEFADQLEKNEKKYYKEHAKHSRDLMRIEDDARSLQNSMNFTSTHLEKLKNTNVFNSTFHIWHKGHFGTINNFCLGRLPLVPVAWSEINAAWGQAALLLSALARKINLTFDRYRVVPFGNHSRIEVIGKQQELPLYGNGGVRYLWDTKFDSAMVAFLDCVQQFQDELAKQGKPFVFPYRIHSTKGKIEDNGICYSIKFAYNRDKNWNRAVVLMFTNLTWLSGYVNSKYLDEPIYLEPKKEEF